jgi:anti-sigma regulatory factor (Ser/Thr protein kinase)
MAGTRHTWSYRAVFEASPSSASAARSFVAGHLVQHGLAHLVEPVRLVASELATNAVLHAHTAFTVTLEANRTQVRLTVRDDSRSLPARRAPQVMDASGRGLEIVAVVSSEWGVDADSSGSKAVWAAFAIPGPEDV